MDMNKYLAEFNEVFGRHILSSLVSLDGGSLRKWQIVQKQLSDMSLGERRSILMYLKSNGFLMVIEDPFQNFVIALTDTGREYLKNE